MYSQLSTYLRNVLIHSRGRVLIAAVLFVAPMLGQANHILGGELTYRCLDSTQFVVQLRLYSDCAGSILAGSQPVQYQSDSCSIPASSFFLPLVDTFELSPLCPSIPTICQGGTSFGVKEWIYEDTITLPQVCEDWHLSFWLGTRSQNYTNINVGMNTNLYVETTLNNTLGCNSTPIFLEKPVLYVYQGQLFSQNLGGVDPDGDSLVYEQIDPMDFDPGSGQPFSVSYFPPFSATYPLTTVPPISGYLFDGQTGNLQFVAPNIEQSLVAVRIWEYRGGVPVGSTIRDMSLLVFDSLNLSPSIISATPVCLDTNMFELLVTIPGTGNFSLTDNQGTPALMVSAASTPISYGMYPNGTVVDLYAQDLTPAGCSDTVFNLTENCTAACLVMIDSLNAECALDLDGQQDGTFDVTVDFSGFGTDFVITNDQDTNSVIVSTPGSYLVGNFPSTTEVTVTVTTISTNGDTCFDIFGPITADCVDTVDCVTPLIQLDSIYCTSIPNEDWRIEGTILDGNDSTCLLAIASYNNPVLIQDTFPVALGKDSTFFFDIPVENPVILFVVDTCVSTGGATCDTIINIPPPDCTPAPPPTNDLCEGAIALSCSYSQTQSFDGATSSPPAGITSCGSPPIVGPGLWYSFRNPSPMSVEYTVSTCNSSGLSNTNIYVFVGANCANLTCVTANDLGPSCFFSRAEVSFNANPFVTYWIYVTDPGVTGANFLLEANCANISIDCFEPVVLIDTTYCLNPQDDSWRLTGTVFDAIGPNLIAMIEYVDPLFGVVLDTFPTGLGVDSTFFFDVPVPEDVILRVEDISVTSGGVCDTVLTIDAPVCLRKPKSEFSLSGFQGCGPTCFDLLNLSLGDTVDNSATIDSIRWTFGDGRSSTSLNPGQVCYQDSGTYAISLLVRNEFGRWDTSTQLVTVYPQPTADIAIDSTFLIGCAPFVIPFSNASINYNSANWAFGDGNTSTLASPTHTYTQAREDPYEVLLVVDFDNQCFDTTKVLIQVVPGPVSGFSMSFQGDSCGGPLTVTLSNQSVDAESFLWDFGNGSANSTRPLPLPAIYIEPDTYSLSLVAIHEFGCQDTSTQSVIIYPQPEAQIQLDSSRGCPPFTVSFTNASVNDNAVQWSFGDGVISTERDPGHTYVLGNADPYRVRLVASFSGQCFDTAFASVRVLEKATAAFDANIQGDTCGGPISVRFVNRSVDGESYKWDLGNGEDPSPLVNPAPATYTSPDTFLASLIATHVSGCPDTTVKPIVIHPKPSALFVGGDAMDCLPVTASPRQADPTGTTSWLWNFGDGGSSVDTFPNYTFTSAGRFEVSLQASYLDLCVDIFTISNHVEAFSNPIADFRVEDVLDNGVATGDVQLVNLSEGADSYFWNFGDTLAGSSNISTEESPQHRYVVNRLYQITLRAATSFGCEDTALREFAPTGFGNLFIPNALMPDSEDPGINVFRPVGIGLQTFHIQIYDQWGGLVWESTTLDNGSPSGVWDGTVGDQLANPDAYIWRVWTATFADGREWPGMIYEAEQRPTRYGTITLIR